MQTERAGKYKNVLYGALAYKAFDVAPLPPNPQLIMDQEMSGLLGKANRILGKLDGISGQIPDVDLFVAMYVRKEALLSSQIEGTQATLDDILDPDIESNTNLEVIDVVNYIKAMQYAGDRLNELPLCNRLLKETHLLLMENVRGQEKSPGEFRITQNWIGPQGGNLKNAVFVPPTVEDMVLAMSDLEKFMNAEDDMDPLIKIGLIHYQFETIHPFLDGNGRIGRMLITLWLMEKKLLQYPVLYISYYFKRNRMEYYDRLSETRRKGHFEEWTRFFLNGVIASSEDAIETIGLIHSLNAENREKIESLSGRKDTVFKLFRYIERNPIIEISKTAVEMKMKYNTIAKAVEKLIEMNILEQMNTGKRNRRFAYSQYLDVLRKDTLV
jgi:Fic family protein